MLSNLAYAQAACAHPREALTLMERAAEIENSMLVAIAPVLSDQQRLGLLEQLTSHLRQVLAIVRQFFADSPDDIHTAFVVADPNFDLAQDAVARGQPDSNAPHFERLYDTRDEGERVAALTSLLAVETHGYTAEDDCFHCVLHNTVARVFCKNKY
jgi:hypothetical protein